MDFDRYKMEMGDGSGMMPGGPYSSPFGAGGGEAITTKIEPADEAELARLMEYSETGGDGSRDDGDGGMGGMHQMHQQAPADSGIVPGGVTSTGMEDVDDGSMPPPMAPLSTGGESDLEPQQRARSNTWPLHRFNDPGTPQEQEEEVTSCHSGVNVVSSGSMVPGGHQGQNHLMGSQHPFLSPNQQPTSSMMHPNLQQPPHQQQPTSLNQQPFNGLHPGAATGAAAAAAAAKKNSSRRNAWGNMSYADLITQAINSTPDQRLTLSQIYDWMVANIPYFKDKGDSNSSAGWKNSIRHNLSLHSRFVRVQNEGTGKSSWWMVNHDAKPGKSARRRATSMETSKFEKKRGRVKKKVESLRNGLIPTPDTGSLCSASPASSVSEGLDMFPDSPLHPGAVPFQLSPDFRPRASSNASSSGGRLSPISGALEPDSGGGWNGGANRPPVIYHPLSSHLTHHMPPPVAPALQPPQQHSYCTDQQLVDNMAEGMKLSRQEGQNSPGGPNGTPNGVYQQHASPSAYDYQKISTQIPRSSPSRIDLNQGTPYSLTNLQAVSPLPSASPSQHPTSTTPGGQDLVSSTPSSSYSPVDGSGTCGDQQQQQQLTPIPSSLPDSAVVNGGQQQQSPPYYQHLNSNGLPPTSVAPSTMMGQVMGAALFNSGSAGQVTGSDIDLNLDSFQDPLDCNVDELIKHELRMDGSLGDFSFNPHGHHHHHLHHHQLHHVQGGQFMSSGGHQFVQFVSQQPVMIQHANGTFSNHLHHHQDSHHLADQAFQGFVGGPTPSGGPTSGAPSLIGHSISSPPSVSRSWVR